MCRERKVSPIVDSECESPMIFLKKQNAWGERNAKPLKPHSPIT